MCVPADVLQGLWTTRRACDASIVLINCANKLSGENVTGLTNAFGGHTGVLARQVFGNASCSELYQSEPNDYSEV
jgi:hypothetical protein